MTRPTTIALLFGASLVLASSPQSPAPRAMSFSNRLLLNRHAVSGAANVEVMLLVRSGTDDAAARRVEHLGGRMLYEDRQVGYARVQLPTEKLVELVNDDTIETYQIASMSRGSWYRDGPPQVNAEMYRGFERVVPNVEPQYPRDPKLSALSSSQATEPGYTADEDAGVGKWLHAHPTFDGRGVTIALLETGQPEFRSPIFGPAKSLDGQDVPKLVGIIDTIGEDEPDDTRVALSVEIEARTAWNRVGDRTYAVPHRGRYRFGVLSLPVAPNLTAQFAVLRDDRTQELWVDANGNGDFRDEPPVPDVNERFEVRTLRVPYPKPMDLGFVVGRGHAPATVHVYLSRGSHQTMTLSVAAGSRTPDGLASGVAAGARVLLVRTQTADYRLRDTIEGYLEAAKRPDVDILCDSAGIVMVPDTTADFVGLLFRRLVAVYRKPIFHAAGNTSQWLSSVFASGDSFAVSGSIGPATFAALYGGASLPRVMVHPVGAAGPAIDGALKPDFVAPVHRVAADLATSAANTPVPKNAPVLYLPAGYQISCCTSASSPYAAGVGALLLSAAKQVGLPYSYEAFSHALRFGARFLPEAPASQQGNGLLDVESAWRALQRPVNVPRIVATADIVHPLAPYGARGNQGEGLFEAEGWTTGVTATRRLRFTRETGPQEAITYRLSWTGNDGTFATANSIRLPLGEIVSLPVAVDVRSAGAHSALLNVHDPATGAIVFRTLSTIVAAERFDQQQTLRVDGHLPLLTTRAHYIHVPPGVSAMAIDLDVVRGAVRAEVLPSHGLYPNYYGHVYPQGGRTFTPGRYHVMLPDPAPGTWTVQVGNTTAWRESERALVSTEEAEYGITVRLLGASLRTQATNSGNITVDVTNVGAPAVDPVVTASLATVNHHRRETLASGLPNLFPIDVPSGTATLALDLRAAMPTQRAFELYLYDCSTGECFSYNFTLPAEPHQRLLVRRPKPGRWIAAVNAAPSPQPNWGFDLEETVVGESVAEAARSAADAHRATWTSTLHLPQTNVTDGARSLFVEIVDRALEHEEQEHPWEVRSIVPKFADRPVAIGTTLQRVP